MRTDSFYITKTSKQCNCCLVNFGNSQYKLFQNSVTYYMWVGVRKAEAQLTRTYFEIKYAPFQIKGYDPFRRTAVSKSLASKLCAFILKTCVAFHASQRLFFLSNRQRSRERNIRQTTYLFQKNFWKRHGWLALQMDCEMWIVLHLVTTHDYICIINKLLSFFYPRVFYVIKIFCCSELRLSLTCWLFKLIEFCKEWWHLMVKAVLLIMLVTYIIIIIIISCW